jgi:CubicO group peptidase (beta-lactamase class C family)
MAKHTPLQAMTPVLLVSICLLLVQVCPAQTKADKAMGKQLDALILQAYPSISPGCVVLIARQGEVIYEKAFGKANLELSVPMTTDMVFRLGSVTKQYTAIAILKLMEEGKLSLSDSIQKFLPGFPAKGQSITIENLLTHTSGIVDYLALNTPQANAPFMIRHDLEPGAIIDLFKNEPLGFIPGTRYSYSNSNYFLLGAIIEKITGKTYREYIESGLLQPAGLKQTYYGGYREIIPNRVSGYAGHKGDFENADYISMTIPYAAGALMASAADLLQWHKALYTGRIVTAETIKKATTPFILKNDTAIEYGYGWQIKTRDVGLSIEHSGAIDGFQTQEIYLPGPDLFIVTLYNALNDGGDDVSYIGLSNDIVSVAGGKSLQKDIILPDSLLRSYVGVYEFDSKHPVVISFENGQLYIEAAAGGLPKSPLYAKNAHLFFLKVVAADIEFVQDSEGKVVQLIAHSKGKDEVCKKMK